jgi:outer membrane protein, heavy metal efflux system
MVPFALSGAARSIACFAFACAYVGHSASAFADADASEARLRDALTIDVVVRLAVARNTTVTAAHEQAAATKLLARSEASLPAPEVMVQVWQVPIAKPYALDSQMIMLGVSQAIPAPGSRAARESAGEAESRVAGAIANDRARAVARDAAHAFADYVESTARHRIHGDHLAVARRILALARARYATRGALTDVTQAEVDEARTEADVVTDETRMASARTRINALLARPLDAPLGVAVAGEPRVPAMGLAELVAHARLSRPELRVADAEREARQHDERAASCEATWPSFNVAALYFAPTKSVPDHGYGFSASMSLPWLWGAAERRRAAAHASAVAASSASNGARISVDGELAAAIANAHSAAQRLIVLMRRALPATRRAYDAAWSGFESGRGDALLALAAERSVVDTNEQVVMTRAALDHAMADLDAAVGEAVPRKALDDLEARHE